MRIFVQTTRYHNEEIILQIEFISFRFAVKRNAHLNVPEYKNITVAAVT